MQQLVIMPGGFHPFHAGHFDLYQQAQQKFPNAEVYVAATNDTSERPFPFALKEKLAKLAGVEAGHFVQVKSPFQAQEITSRFDPNATQLIFVRSTKDQNKPPQPGGVKKNGEPAYLQPYTDDATAPMSQHGYMTYLPTVEFGPGMTSATEIRNAWPQLNQRQRKALIMSMYPAARANPKLADTVVKMLDTVIVQENQGWAATYEEDLSPLSEYTTANTQGSGAGITAGYQRRENQPIDEEYDYIEEKWSQQYKRSINCNNPQGFSQKAHCAGRKK